MYGCEGVGSSSFIEGLHKQDSDVSRVTRKGGEKTPFKFCLDIGGHVKGESLKGAGECKLQA